jgi:hypothetical protein
MKETLKISKRRVVIAGVKVMNAVAKLKNKKQYNIVVIL